MSLSPGDGIGAFEIASALGAGGMGEVYRARDTRLGRDVALKILPDAFARDAEHLARFDREARALAALNHPNIGAIYGLEDVGSQKALVLELIDGPTLADRIAAGPLSIDDVRAVARQIAEALEAAHEAGIIHRDLKPANIKLRPDGTVKVLDFGLAKAVEPGARPNDRALANSPTITARATRAGVLLGTAAYMSPEQARGLRVDKRSDLWAFGCIVYEMLTGQQVFGGDTISDSIANVLHRDVNWSRLPARTPQAIVRMLERCLARDVKARLRDAADARLELDDAVAHAEARRSKTATTNAARVPWIIAAGAILAATAAGAWAAFAPSRSVQPSAPVRYTIPAPDGYDFGANTPAFAWSPDGHALVVVLGSPSFGTTQLAVRQTDDVELQPLRGSERGTQPFFLADGRVGFYRAGAIQAIDVSGGVAKPIVRASRELSGASAGPDDSILFADRSERGPFALMQAPASGGARTVVAEPRSESGETGLLWPHLLPDRQHVLLTVALEEGRYRLDVLSLSDSTRRSVVDDGFAGAYASGHLVYFKAGGPADSALGGIPGVLIAAPFDVGTLAVRGQPVTVVDELVASLRLAGVRGIDVAAGGASLAIGRRSARGNFTASLASVGRDKSMIRLGTWNMPFRTLALSPDGQRIAAGTEGENRDVWLYDLSREIPSRVTIAPREEETPQWSPDGKRLAFAAHVDGRSQLIVATPDEGTTVSLWTTDGHLHVNGWSTDGMTIYMNVRLPATGEDIWTYSLKDRSAKPLLHTAAAEFGAAPSSDGRWVAYVCDESGRRETYVTDSTGSMRIQVSRDGGVEPMWSSDGRELFFRSVDGSTILGVSVQNGDPLRVGAPEPLVRFDFPVPAPLVRDRAYSVTPDGKRFIVIRLEETPAPSPRVDVTLNWAAGLPRSARPDR